MMRIVGVEPIPVVPAGEILHDHPLWWISRLHAGGDQIDWIKVKLPRTDQIGGRLLLSRWSPKDFLIERIVHIRNDKQRQLCAGDRAVGDPVGPRAGHLSRSPKTGDAMRINAVENIDLLHVFWPVGGHGCDRHAIRRLEINLKLRCAGKGPFFFQHAVEEVPSGKG